MEFCRFLRSVKFVVQSLGRFLGRGVCLWLQRSQGSRVFLKNWHISSPLQLKSMSSLRHSLNLSNQDARSSFFETHFKIKTSDKFYDVSICLRSFLSIKKKINKTLHIRSKIKCESMKRDKICTKRYKRQVTKTKKKRQITIGQKLFKTIYEVTMVNNALLVNNRGFTFFWPDVRSDLSGRVHGMDIFFDLATQFSKLSSHRIH